MFLLEPSLYSKSIINQNETKRATFYYSSTTLINYAYIELWTNLSIHQDWHAVRFIGHKATVNLSRLKPNQNYEFTVRYKSTEDEPWSWLGQPGQNGSIYLIDTSVQVVQPPTFASVPQLKFVAKHQDLWHFKTRTSSGVFSLGVLPHPIHSYTAIIRKGSVWLTPVSGYDSFDDRVKTNEKWQVLLYQDKEQGHVHMWLVINDQGDCWLSPNTDNSLDLHHNHEASLIIVSSKTMCSSLVKFALDYYYERNNGRKQQQHTVQPVMINKLGYCTWNAFGQDLSMDKLMSCLEENIPIGYLLLDDGWQCISEQRQLNGFDAMKERFPKGLKQSIETLKSKFPAIEYIGVWHTLWGYWNGVSEELIATLGGEWVSYASIQGDQIGIMKNPDMFYHEFYAYLKEQGVDFVKVDNQGGFQDLTGLSEDERMVLWNAYRSSLIEHGDTFFNGHIIHCMALTPPILFHPIFSSVQSSLFRNSDDFFPDEMASHSWHIYANSINTLLTSYYPIIPDWDMFQSNHPFAEYHAISRAISGSPIYISDPPHQINPDLIYKLLGETRHEGFTLLRSSQSPQPTFHTVFNNPMGTHSFISIYNTNQEEEESQGKDWISPLEYCVCAFFNTSSDQQQLTVIYPNTCPPVLSKKNAVAAYVVHGPDEGKCNMYTFDEEEIMVCRVNSVSLVSISPVSALGLLSIACLGLVDKFNGTKAILQTKLTSVGVSGYNYRCLLSHRSQRCGFLMKSVNSKKATFIPRSVALENSKPAVLGKDWTWDEEKGLVVIDMTSVPLDSSTNDYFTINIKIEKIALFL